VEKIVIVLAMHGAPPSDFSKREMAELFSLHSRLASASEMERRALQPRYAELDTKMREWPRTSSNDPFYAASQELAEHLRQATHCEVVVGFNEFCSPGLDEALDQAVTKGAEKVVVVTPMTTRGGEHAEVDIPRAIQEATEQHPGIAFRYAWPFPVPEVAQLLADHIAHFV